MQVTNSRYKVIRVIGKGAYGEIMLAEDLKHHQSVQIQGRQKDNQLAREIEKMVAIKKMRIDDKVGIE